MSASTRFEVIFDLEHLILRLKELENQTLAADFWNDNEAAQGVLKEQSQTKATIADLENAQTQIDDAQTMCELAIEGDDKDSLKEASDLTQAATALVEQLEFARMLSGPNDRNGALVDINAGAGGTDSQDWAEMLARMYMRWAERRGYKVELLDRQPGEEAGIKSMTIGVNGDYAFGYLQAESGVHRIVRISPFDTQARRHTAFAAVHVSPDVADDVEVDIDEEELKIDVYRAGGAGGQHVNKTESAVRITHLPTGIVVQCQNERSQHKNKAQAMRVLRSRLFELEEKRRQDEMSEMTAQKKSIEWGSQIRSYVLAPYRQVSDHRTELKIGNVDAVLDGDIDPFIQSYLLSDKGKS